MHTPDFESLKIEIEKSKSIVIVMHKGPDGDAIGSALGLANVLLKLNKSIAVIAPNEFSENLKWVPGNHLILDHYHQKEEVKEAFATADLLFCLDFNEPSRAWHVEPLIREFTGYKAMIDHHQEPADFTHFTYSDTTASSTCELVFKTVKALYGDTLFCPTVGKCLYLGLVTDTGSFRFQSATSETLTIAAYLLDLGVNQSEIYDNVFDQNPINRLKLTGYALSHKLEFFPEFATALITLSQEEMEKYHYKPGYTEGLVNYGLSIQGAHLACLMSEKDGQVRISFRSRGSFSVNEFSRGHFNGGGHNNAAGGISKETLTETREKFLKLLPFYKNNIVNS
ncbi:MAG: DHH family phosphoesterase [Luteibaculaceae bacterium]